MKRAMARALAVLVCIAALIFTAVSPCAYALEVGTSVNVTVEGFEIKTRTEDFALQVGGGESLRVTASRRIRSYHWELSRDGGATWSDPEGTVDGAEYEIVNAQRNTDADGKDLAYRYRVTVTDDYGESAEAVIKVLVSDSYGYRTVSLREGDTDVSAYMHDETRLMVTPLGADSAASITLTAELDEGTTSLLAYDVSLVNRNAQAVPYIGTLQVDFHVGTAYEGMTLKVYHLHADGSVSVYSGTVAGGVLSVLAESLSPFLVEVPDASAHAVTVTVTGSGSVSPSGRVNVPNGADRTFTLLPDAGQVIGSVTLDGAPLSPSGNSVTLRDVRGAHSLAVSFSPATPSSELHTLSITNGAHGTASPSGTVRVSHGAAQTVYLYPDRGYELDALTVNGTPMRVVGSSYTLSAVVADAVINASFRQATTQPPDVYRSITASSGENGDISPVGENRVEYGGGMYFYFIPSSGYEVDTVTVDGAAATVSGDRYHFVNVVAPHTISVSFKPVSAPPPPAAYFTVTASSGAGGSVSPGGSVRVPRGGSQSFSLEPAAGYEIDAVTVDGVVTAVSGSAYEFTDVTADHSIAVSFRQTPPPTVYYTVSASSGLGGSVSPSGDIRVASGGSQTLAFIPDSGYELDTLTIDGITSGIYGNAFVLSNITEDHTVYAAFRRIAVPAYAPPAAPAAVIYHTISASAGPHGSISPQGSVRLARGGSQTFYFIPEAGYRLASVTVDGAAVDVSDGSYSFTDVAASHSIRATFDRAPGAERYHSITATSGEHGDISPGGVVRAADGGSAYFALIPDEGYEVDVLTVDGERAEAPGGSYCFNDVSADHAIHVSFRKATEQAAYHSISVVIDGQGGVSPAGPVRVAHGGAQTFYLIPGEGCEVGAIYLDGVKQEVTANYFAVEAVTGDTELKVSFRPAESMAGGAGGTIRWYWAIPLGILTVGGVAGLIMLLSRRRRRW